jgi:transposase
MRPRLFVSESDSTLIEKRLEQRATIVALSMGGIDPGSISWFTSTHLATVRRWVCRIEEGNPLSDRKRCGRPRRISEASRIMTIAVYCQHNPPLPGVHRWSLRDAQNFFKDHPEPI